MWSGIKNILINSEVVESSLAKNTFIYAIGNVGVLTINFILVPFYTFFLSKSSLGFYDFIVTNAMFLAPFATLQIEMAILRWLLDTKTKKSKQYVIASSLFVFIFNMFIFSILYFFFAKYLINQYESLVFIYLILFFTYPLFKQIVRGLGKSKQYVFVEISYTLIFLLLSIFFIAYLKFDVKGLLISNILSLLIVIIFIIISNKLYSFINLKYLSIELTREMLKYSIPMILNISSVWFMTSAIKYFIVYFNGYSDNGIYTVAYKFASIIQIINSVFYLSWQEEAIKSYKIGNYQGNYTMILDQYLIFLTSLLIAISGIAPLIMPYVIGENFHDAIHYMPLLALGFLFMSLGSFYGVFYQCEKKTMGLSISAFISGLLVVVLSFIFKNTYNLMTASLIFVFSFFVFFLYRLVDVKRFIRIPFPFIKILIALLFYSFIFVSNQFLSCYNKIFVIFLSILIFLFIYRSDIISIIKSFNILKYVKRN